jgi:glyoxylase-like metal-dependent hydrolase (beta-lactamase superfamily II)
VPPLLTELSDGILRVTLPLPAPPGHVHAYLLPGADGWTVVDTGLGLPDAAELWRGALAEAGDPVAHVVVTHFHPDHVGAATDVAELTGAPVLQGELDLEQCRRVWGTSDWPERMAAWFRLNGVPDEIAGELVEQGRLYAAFIRFAPDARPLGEEVAGWRVIPTPGHADGHICLLRDGVLVAGDHVLAGISPTVGLYPEGRPDPLRDYLESLRLVARLAPRLALPGHGEPIDDPAVRARELLDHHDQRLAETAAALDASARTGYELSFALFGEDLAATARRFAVAETLSHAEWLVADGLAKRASDGRTVRYRAA